MERWDDADTADTAETPDAQAQQRQRQRQLAQIDTLLAQWEAWRRKQITQRPPLSREFLETWRAQLLAESDDESRAA